MSVRADLHRLLDELDDASLPEVRSYLRWLSTESHASEESDQDVESDEPNPADPEHDRLGKPTGADDPLWNIIGIGRTDEETDVARHKDEYLADAFGPEHPRS